MNQKISSIAIMVFWGAAITLLLAHATMAAPVPEEPSFPGTAEEAGPAPAAAATANATSPGQDTARDDKQYYNPYAVPLTPYSPYARIPPSVLAADGRYNPFPNYYPSQLGGITGPGNKASSCAFAYPNRRYSCLGLGRK